MNGISYTWALWFVIKITLHAFFDEIWKKNILLKWSVCYVLCQDFFNNITWRLTRTICHSLFLLSVCPFKMWFTLLLYYLYLFKYLLLVVSFLSHFIWVFHHFFLHFLIFKKNKNTLSCIFFPILLVDCCLCLSLVLICIKFWLCILYLLLWFLTVGLFHVFSLFIIYARFQNTLITWLSC